ncbi:MAG: DegQ family serine endoprotease [Alphaproteobacteria bacterium]|nr:MAG: DegQ family serine endoprotease [Alphaproteobacteria bacterium]
MALRPVIMRTTIVWSLLLALALAGLPQTSVLAQRAPENGEEIRLSFAPIVKRSAPAVVNVYATQMRRETRSPFAGDPFFERFFGHPFGMPRERAKSSLGSGVIVGEDGIIVTNNHVVRDATKVRVVTADGREYRAEILLRDEKSDLAVLKISNGDEEFPVLEFADSDDLEVGDLVLAIGNPFGVGQTVTSGIVSAVARTNIGVSDLSFFIQTDAAINPGNSGGALVDMRGDLVGINTAIFSRSGGSIGLGFAIPSNMVRNVVAQALAGSSEVVRPWIGAAFQRVTPDIARSLGLNRPRGALVTRVSPDSPAALAGLRVGDLVLSIGNREVQNPAAVEYRLALYEIGARVRLKVLRRGEELRMAVRLERPPETVDPDLHLITGRSPLAGARVANLSPRLAIRLNLPADKTGVAVVDVDRGSPAARLGLRQGDVIVRIQGNAIGTSQQLVKATARRDRFWRLTIDRKGRISNYMIGG